MIDQMGRRRLGDAARPRAAAASMGARPTGVIPDAAGNERATTARGVITAGSEREEEGEWWRWGRVELPVRNP